MKLDAEGLVVDRVHVDFAVVVKFVGGVELRIESPLELQEAGEPSRAIAPGAEDITSELQALLSCREVTQMDADERNGELVVQLSGGIALKVRADPDYEAWSVSWPDGRIVLSTPGGELASWGARD